MMTLFLGVDGGGTGCRVILADDQGRALARATAGPANISSDPQTALGNILSATRTALAQALGAGQVEAALPRIIAGLGLAGANAAGASAWLAQALPFARCRIETDAITAVKGALRGDDGIVAAIGTGSVFGVQRAARIRQIGGWGFALGDEGSGAVLGCKRCWTGLAHPARSLASA
jgi:glucosamine kinase